jgi:hypothetical protein
MVRAVAPIRPVHKSPSLTAAENWLPTAVSMVKFAVPIDMCFLNREGWPDQGDCPDRQVVGVVMVVVLAREIGREIGKRASLLMLIGTLSRLTTLTGCWTGWSGWTACHAAFE